MLYQLIGRHCVIPNLNLDDYDDVQIIKNK